MITITIPKELRKGDLVIVPRKVYEELVDFKKKMAPTFKPTKAELRALERGRKNFTKGNYITLEELENELDRNHRRKR